MKETSTRAERLLAGIFLGTVLFFMCSIFCVIAVRHTSFLRQSDNLNDAALSPQKQDILPVNWPELYPFSEEQSVPTAKVSKKFEEIYSYIQDKVTLYTTTDFLVYRPAILFAKQCEELIGWNLASMTEYNGVVKLHDGYFTTFIEKRNVSESAQSTVELAKFCEENGIDFLYVNAPYKVCKIEDADISGTLDFSNQNADEFLRQLKNAGINYYDLREALHKENMSHHGAFYRADLHWRAETGLWAARHILQLLRDRVSYPVDPAVLEADKFTSILYPSWFLGSQGKKITLARTKPDDFVLLYPKYPTLLHYQFAFSNIDVTGDFSVTYDMSQVQTMDYYNRNPYHAYNHGPNTVVKSRNMILENDIQLVLIHDSFAYCVMPFLALGIEKIDALDLRHFNGSVHSCISSMKPDIVIVLYNPEWIGEPIDWQSHTSLFDFR